MVEKKLSRRVLMKTLGIGTVGASLGGFASLGLLATSNTDARKIIQSAEGLTYKAHRTLVPHDALAPEFTKADIRQSQYANGNTNPREPEYLAHVQTGFEAYQLEVDGRVNKPLSLSLDRLKNMQNRTQITRHDCVEGWSNIAEWTGVPLKSILEMAELKSDARYVVFHCFDTYSRGLVNYYESIDMVDAFHPQTILAHTMNGDALPIRNGAPLRVRVERQLGYKMAKYLKRIEVVSSFADIQRGRGGYWPDRGYEWFAAI